MIDAIYAIGKSELKNKPLDNEGMVSVLVEDPASNQTYKHVFTINLKFIDDSIEYEGVSLEEYSNSKIPQYLYRKGSSNGPDITITSRITTPDKTKKTKFEGWCKQDHSTDTIGLTDQEIKFISAVKKTLLAHKDEIFSDISHEFEPISKNKENAFITLTFDDGSKKYLGNYSAFRKILISDGISVFYSKYNKTARSPDQLCSVCREIVPEVYGFASTYNFYTVDKPGMVAGGFDQSQAWKDYPVCQNCALTLEKGKDYLNKSALFRFYGFSYYVIPKSVLKSSISEVYERLAEYHKEGSNLKLTGKYRNLLDETQEEIFDCLSEGENSFLINIMIFEKSNNEFKILTYIEDIFPSRLRELFNAKDRVDSHQIVRSCEVTVFEEGKPVKKPTLEFSFSNYRYFFNKQDKKDPYFLDIVRRIFTGKCVSYPFLMWAISAKIRDQFNQGYLTKEACMRGLSALVYLHELDLLIDFSEGNSMTNKQVSVFDSVTPREVAITAERIFNEFKPFFNQDAKKAIFLEGVLAQLLLDIQYRERDKATPFRVKLQGLKLDQRTVQKLLPMIQNKLEEYGKNYYRDLERLISEYMIAAGDKWNLSKDEISYYFVLGMNLAQHFKTKSTETNEGAE